jgi:uncharacterized Tic20 family protein
MFLYSLVLAMIAIPILIVSFFKTIPSEAIFNENFDIENHFSFENNTGIVIVAIIAILLFVGLKVAEFFLILFASVKASNGEKFKYPFSIPFIK